MDNTIIYVGNFSYSNMNAAGKRVFYNSKLLNEIGYKVIMIGVTKQKENMQQPINVDESNIQVYELKYPQKTYNWIEYKKKFKEVTKIIENQKNVKGIIFYGSPAISIFIKKLITYSKKNNIKIYSDCADWLSNYSNNILFNLFKGIDYNYQKRILNKKTDGIILISDYLKKYYKKQKCIVIPPLNEINYSKICECKDDKIKLCYAGIPFRLNQKNIKPEQMKDRLDLIIDFLYEVYKVNKNFDFDIYGLIKDEYLYAVPRHKDILNEMTNIRFYGLLNFDEIQTQIKKSDYTILFRDRTRETMAGFSTKIAESLSLFTPVITNDTSNIKKYIIDEKNGYIINIQDKEESVKKLIKIFDEKQNINKMKHYCKDNQLFYYKNYIEEMRWIISGE